MDSIKLDAGRFYKLRSGQVVYIISKNRPTSQYQFQGSILGTIGYLQWAENGIYDIDIGLHPFDIIKEVQPKFK